MDYKYKFCDKTRLKEAQYNKLCQPQSGERKLNQQPHRRHPHHAHRNSLAERFRSVNNPFASFEQIRSATVVAAVEDDSSALATSTEKGV